MREGHNFVTRYVRNTGVSATELVKFNPQELIPS